MQHLLPSRQWETSLDGIQNLRLEQRAVQQPAADEILVKITAVTLNYKDGETINGLFKHHKSNKAPDDLVPCSDSCGHVVALGSDVKRWEKGDRVLSTSYPTHLTGQIGPEHLSVGVGAAVNGCLCEYCIFKETAVAKCPDYLTDEEACCFQIAGTTAWMAINGFRPLGHPLVCQGGEKPAIVLLQGTGGVSIMGLLIAKASGAEVILTSSSDEKLQRAKDLGTDHLINYRKTPEWHEKVLSLTDGKGADIIFENGGAATTAKSFQCIRFGGLINSIGYVSGKVDPPEERQNINVSALLRNVTLKGIVNGPRDRFEELLQFCAERKIKPVVDKVFKFEEAKEALQYLWDGSHFGKIVIKVGDA